MALSKEEKEQLEALTKKSKEPDAPPHNVNFTLDLGNDTAWERARNLGIVRDPEPEEKSEEEEEPEDGPKRRGGGAGFFGGS